jgi:anaerobic glycerol-3-phosphate dehydrogenase
MANQASNKTLVIGAGLAGLTAGWQSAVSGAKTLVIAKGWGATHWHSGCIDVLGYSSHSEYRNAARGVKMGRGRGRCGQGWSRW